VPRAIILAGGYGTRLRPYTTVLPKPLMPVGDRPVLDIVVRQLVAQGFDRITMSTGHLAELIEAFFMDGRRYDVAIDYLREEEPLGTAGAISLVDDLDEDVLVMNGDILTELDYAALLTEHRASDAMATIATQQRSETIALGVLRFDGSGGDADRDRVRGYDEKPEYTFDASMGVYCFSPGIANHLEHGEHLDFPDLVKRLLAAGQEVRAWRSDAFWLDIGMPRDYERAQEVFESMRGRLLPGG
jgi:NDP-sugar pyrophosphorylase family protein